MSPDEMDDEADDDYEYDEEMKELMDNPKRMNKAGSLDRLGGRHSDLRRVGVPGPGNRSSMGGSVNRRNERA